MAKYIHVILAKPASYAKLVAFAKAVLAAMTGNAKFPNAGTLLAALAAAIKMLDDAMDTGTSTERQAGREAVAEALKHLADHVQSVAETVSDTVDLNAIRAMVESANLKLRKAGPRPKGVFGAKNGQSAGSVDLTAPGNKKHDPHEWEISTDQHTWTALPSTRRAKTRVTGLPLGVTHYFRHRTLTKAGHTDWSDPIMIVVR